MRNCAVVGGGDLHSFYQFYGQGEIVTVHDAFNNGNPIEVKSCLKLNIPTCNSTSFIPTSFAVEEDLIVAGDVLLAGESYLIATKVLAGSSLDDIFSGFKRDFWEVYSASGHTKQYADSLLNMIIARIASTMIVTGPDQFPSNLVGINEDNKNLHYKYEGGDGWFVEKESEFIISALTMDSEGELSNWIEEQQLESLPVLPLINALNGGNAIHVKSCLAYKEPPLTYAFAGINNLPKYAGYEEEIFAKVESPINTRLVGTQPSEAYPHYDSINVSNHLGPTGGTHSLLEHGGGNGLINTDSFMVSINFNELEYLYPNTDIFEIGIYAKWFSKQAGNGDMHFFYAAGRGYGWGGNIGRYGNPEPGWSLKDSSRDENIQGEGFNLTCLARGAGATPIKIAKIIYDANTKLSIIKPYNSYTGESVRYSFSYYYDLSARIPSGQVAARTRDRGTLSSDISSAIENAQNKPPLKENTATFEQRYTGNMTRFDFYDYTGMVFRESYLDLHQGLDSLMKSEVELKELFADGARDFLDESFSIEPIYERESIFKDKDGSIVERKVEGVAAARTIKFSRTTVNTYHYLPNHGPEGEIVAQREVW